MWWLLVRFSVDQTLPKSATQYPRKRSVGVAGWCMIFNSACSGTRGLNHAAANLEGRSRHLLPAAMERPGDGRRVPWLGESVLKGHTQAFRIVGRHQNTG